MISPYKLSTSTNLINHINTDFSFYRKTPFHVNANKLNQSPTKPRNTYAPNNSISDGKLKQSY